MDAFEGNNFFMQYWNFFQQFQYPGGPTYLEMLLTCWGWTFKIALASWLVALSLGALIGTIRTLPEKGPLNRSLIAFGNGWVNLFRNIPILLQMFLWLFVLPHFIPPVKALIPHPFIMAILALGFFTSARIAEQFKAGIGSVPRGQRDAARALGLNTVQTYRYILLPIAVRIIMPPLTSEAMNIVKNSTAAIALSAMPELLQFAQQVGAEHESYILQIYLVVTILFAITSIAFNLMMRFVDNRLKVPGFISGASAGGR